MSYVTSSCSKERHKEGRGYRGLALKTHKQACRLSQKKRKRHKWGISSKVRQNLFIRLFSEKKCFYWSIHSTCTAFQLVVNTLEPCHMTAVFSLFVSVILLAPSVSSVRNRAHNVTCLNTSAWHAAWVCGKEQQRWPQLDLIVSTSRTTLDHAEQKWERNFY